MIAVVDIGADEELEGEIESVRSVLEFAPEREQKFAVWCLLVRLISLRTPAQVEALERARGLRK